MKVLRYFSLSLAYLIVLLHGFIPHHHVTASSQPSVQAHQCQFSLPGLLEMTFGFDPGQHHLEIYNKA